MKISDFLFPAHVMINMRARDKSRLLEQLSIQAAGEVGLARDEVVTEIAKREELGSTGVGNGVALPHARLRGLNTPFGLLARLHRGIDFNAIDGEPVDIVFFLLLPESRRWPRRKCIGLRCSRAERSGNFEGASERSQPRDTLSGCRRA